MDVQVNYLAVVIAGLSTMVVGAIWYTPKVFGDMWMHLAKVKSDKNLSGLTMARMYSTVFLASLVSAYVLAHVIFLSNSYFQNTFLQDALSTGFWVWLGFTALRMFTHDVFEGRPFRLTVLNAAHELVTVMVMALIIGLFAV